MRGGDGSKWARGHRQTRAPPSLLTPLLVVVGQYARHNPAVPKRPRAVSSRQRLGLSSLETACGAFEVAVADIEVAHGFSRAVVLVEVGGGCSKAIGEVGAAQKPPFGTSSWNSFPCTGFGVSAKGEVVWSPGGPFLAWRVGPAGASSTPRDACL